MAMPLYGGTASPMASSYGQLPGVGYMGTAMPMTGVAGMPYAGAGFGATAYPFAGMYATPAYQAMGALPCQGGYPPSTGTFSGVNGFNMPPGMQSFNGAGYYGCGAGMGMIDPYNPYMDANPYMELMNPMGSYTPSDFEDDLMRSRYSHYGRGMRRNGSFGANDGYHHHQPTLGEAMTDARMSAGEVAAELEGRSSSYNGYGRGRNSYHDPQRHRYGEDSYYDPQRGRYVQRRPKQACC